MFDCIFIDVAPLVVVQYVQPAPVVGYVTPAPQSPMHHLLSRSILSLRHRPATTMTVPAQLFSPLATVPIASEQFCPLRTVPCWKTLCFQGGGPASAKCEDARWVLEDLSSLPSAPSIFYSSLKVAPEEHPILPTNVLLNPKAFCERMTQIGRTLTP